MRRTTSARVVRAPAAGPRVGGPLTTRAAILGLVVFTLVFSAVLPLKTFLEQRGRIAEMERGQAAARERVAALEEAKRQLQDPAFVASEARRRLNMARPGEISYVLVDPAPTPDAVPAQTADAAAPWWSQLLSSVAQADRGSATEGATAPPAP